MKKQLVIVGIIVLLLTVGLSGCNDNSIIDNPERNKFIGSWERVQGGITYPAFTFESDGTLLSAGWDAGTWNVKEGNRLELYIKYIGGDSVTQVYDYVFSDNDNTLTFIPVGTSQDYVYHKKI